MTLAAEPRAIRSGWGRPLQRFGWLPLVLVVLALPPLFLGDSYLLSLFVSIGFYGIVVVSLDLLLGYGGLPTFGHTGFFALGAFVMGVLASNLGVPLALGMLAAVLVNLVLAAVIGFATLRLREYYFAVATLGFAVIVIQVIGGLPDLTGGWSGIRNMPQPSLFDIVLRTDQQFYAIVAIGLLLSLALGRNLIGSRFGRAIRAISQDQLAAETLGIAPTRHKIQLFMVSATIASLAGSFYGLYLRVPTPANFDIPVMVDMVLMLYLGGRATLWGGLLGATIVRLLPELLGRFQDYRVLLQGLIFVLILIFMPNGIAGLRPRWRRQSQTGRDQPYERRAVSTAVHASPAVVSTHGGALFAPAEPTSDLIPLLVAERLNKRFGGLHAVKDLDLAVYPNQIKAIIGPNGAGKTTAFNLLTRVTPADSGRIDFRGTNVNSLKPHEVARLGMVRTFQTPRLFGAMTVLENVMVGHHAHVKGTLAEALVPTSSTRRKEEEVRASSLALLQAARLGGRAHLPASSLPFGERRLLEIVRCLALRPSLMLLDEPAAGLNESEKNLLGDFLLELRATGLTLLLVEHDMRLVMRLADEVLVMDQGSRIAEGPPSVIQEDRDVMRAYLGTDLVVAPASTG